MENCKQAHFVLKVDDDVIINTPRLVTILSDKYAQVNQTIFCAEVRPKATARIYRQGKNKVENTQFPKYDVQACDILPRTLFDIFGRYYYRPTGGSQPNTIYMAG